MEHGTAESRVDGVDGVRYTVGSLEHRRYVDRYDAAYLALHQHLVQRNATWLRSMEGLNDRIRQDANQTAFLARELVHVRGTIERKIYESLRMREFVDVEMHPPGAMTYATQQLDMTGEAKVTHDLAGDDPRADVKKEEDQGKYVNVRGAYAYDVQDLEQAAFAGVPLPRWKADACAEMIARGVDKVGRIGDAASGLTGFFNNPDVPVVTMTNGEWLTATADEIVDDVKQLEQAIISGAKDTQPQGRSYRLVLPSAYEGRLLTLQRSSGSDLSVARYILANTRLIGSIERYGALDSASGADTGVTDDPELILYPRNPLVVFWPMSIVYEEQAPQLDGWEWSVRARARVGGIEVRRPIHMVYGENLD